MLKKQFEKKKIQNGQLKIECIDTKGIDEEAQPTRSLGCPTMKRIWNTYHFYILVINKSS